MRKKEIIEIMKEIKINEDVILEVGDKIEVLKENMMREFKFPKSYKSASIIKSMTALDKLFNTFDIKGADALYDIIKLALESKKFDQIKLNYDMGVAYLEKTYSILVVNSSSNEYRLRFNVVSDSMDVYDLKNGLNDYTNCMDELEQTIETYY